MGPELPAFVTRFLQKVFGSRNERIVKSLRARVDEISALEPAMKASSDEELAALTEEFRREFLRQAQEQGLVELQEERTRYEVANDADMLKEVRRKIRHLERQILDGILPRAFAAAREAAVRTLGMRHFDVQLMGGMVLHSGSIAEMVTGEGKTLVATLAAYLNAIPGHGVHVITVNDYLARRDAEWMAPVYRFLGLEVGCIQSDMDSAERRVQYACDITYGTNNEFGFDYLRDNMKLYREDQSQGRLHYAIIDEVDSILVDEARTPLIISGQAEESTEKYYKAAQAALRLREDDDYEVKEKEHQIVLTDEGIEHAERLVGVDSFYTGANMDWPHHIDQALKAKHLYRRDREYIVKEGEVVIVDEFTGRLMPGRTWSDGLHQAVEAKEGLRIKSENQTLATITFQNFFRLYDKIAGMTGTAMTEAEEFQQIYGLDVVAIPTNRPLVRRDLSDRVYRTEREKFKAIVDEIEAIHRTGRPILVGTISIENNERLSEALSRRGIPHEVLNAKNHAREAQIITRAGELGGVTIATNMAGRGTDIKLGSFTREELLEHWKSKGLAPKDVRVDGAGLQERLEAYWKEEGLLEDWEYRETLMEWEADGGRTCTGLPLVEGIRDLGGLHVLGSERHEARRIDNQLRGRCGRQGDPGSTVFFLSLEDSLMRIFAPERVSRILERLGMTEGQEISHGMVNRAIERAQRKVEARNFDIRKHLLEYDEVMDEQRKVIYARRQNVLSGGNVRETIRQWLADSVEGQVRTYMNEAVPPAEWDMDGMCLNMRRRYAMDVQPSDLEGKAPEDIARELVEGALRAYDLREQRLGEEQMRRIERFVLLQKIDEKWKDHLRTMDELRSGVGFVGYAQVDPKVEYKKRGYATFATMIESVTEEISSLVMRVRIGEDEEVRNHWRIADYTREFEAHKARQEAAQAASKGPVKPIVGGQSPERNAPCPCGSGKKFKKCCGRNE